MAGKKGLESKRWNYQPIITAISELMQKNIIPPVKGKEGVLSRQ